MKIFASQGAPLVSTPPMANLLLASTTLAANFATSSAGVVYTDGNDTSGKFAAANNLK
jgi:hypothetical protein